MGTFLDFKQYDDNKYKIALGHYYKVPIQDRDSILANSLIAYFTQDASSAHAVKNSNETFINFDWSNPNHKQAWNALSAIPKSQRTDFIINSINRPNSATTEVGDNIINKDRNTINIGELEMKLMQMVRSETERVVTRHLPKMTGDNSEALDEDKIRAIVESIVQSMNLSKGSGEVDFNAGGIKDFEMSENGEVNLDLFNF